MLAEASLTNGLTGAVLNISDPVRGSSLQAYGTADTAGTPATGGRPRGECGPGTVVSQKGPVSSQQLFLW
jgi:hypothetical protein